MPTAREFAVDVIRTLREAGHEALLAGGCVRDELLGVEPNDYDIATSARPEQVRQLFRRTVAVGAAFGVVEVLGPHRLIVQVATFRSDGAYIDGRRPESVVFCSAEEDAQRRDFTINGMFFDPLDERLIDHVGGKADLQARILRAIGDAEARFREDRLRILRAVRMAARFDLEIDPATSAAIARMAPQLNDGVSAERIADEFRKMLVDPHRARALRLFMDLGLAAVVLPELGAKHGLAVVERLGETTSFPLAFAALLHPVGRRIAGEISLRLKLSSEERERIEWLVENHRILADSRAMRPARLKPLLVHPGIDDLMAMHRAEGRDLDALEHAVALRRSWDEAGELNPAPLLTGNDLLALGLPQGPMYKILLQRVRDAQLDGEIATHEEAIGLVKRILAGQT